MKDVGLTMRRASSEYDAAGWPRTHEQCPVFRTTGSHIRVWGLDDGNGKIRWRALPPSEDEVADVLHSFEICLECSDGTARNIADGRLMSVSWPTIGGVRGEVAPAHLQRWVAEGTDPDAALAQMLLSGSPRDVE